MTRDTMPYSIALSAHPEIALHVAEHLLVGLAGLLRDRARDALAHAQDLLRLNRDVRRRSAGAAERLVDHEARVRQAHPPLLVRGEEDVVPALATQPVPMVVTGAPMKRMTSWIASPDSACPPGEEISTRIGASDCCASATRPLARRARDGVVDVAEQEYEARLERQLVDDAFRALLVVALGLVVFLVVVVVGAHGGSFECGHAV